MVTGEGRDGPDETEPPPHSNDKARVSVEYHHSDRFSISLRNSKVQNFIVDVEGLGATSSGCDKSGKTSSPVPITLKFEDVEYRVTIKPQQSWFEYKSWGKRIVKQGVEKSILKGVTGVVKPGEILAMLGPSGSGKTTLLSVLGGRIKGQLTGKVLFNDATSSKAMKRRTGFVTQDDVLFAHLTVKETLVYAAYLKLPREISKAAKMERAEDVIRKLGLEKCKDTIIGGPFLRGVSGGERKRVSIGHELLIDPSLLLLDEPTSGLDSTIALKIIHTLQDLARDGRTIVTTIHQPSSIIFHTFTKLLLLSDGHTLYYGRGPDAMPYFESVGFKPSYATNPADFLLDLANGVTYDVLSLGNEEESGSNTTSRDPSKEPTDILLRLREAYKKTLEPRARCSLSEAPRLTDEEFRASQEKRKWPTTFFEQFHILLTRGVKERRHEVFAGLRIAQVAAISLICGLLWWQSSPQKIQDQVGLLFFLTTFWGFFPVFTAIFTFPQERQMLMKERASGMYRLTSYFFARTMGDMPLELVVPTISITIVYWMGGLKATAGAFIGTLGVMLLNVLVSQGMGLLLGAALMDVKKATTLSSVILLTFQLAGGYFVQETPGFISWIKYLSFSYYTYKLQLASQYSKTETYPCDTGRCRILDYPSIQKMGIDNLGISVMALLIMLVGYRFLAYLALRRMKI